MTQGAGLEYSLQAALTLSRLRARAEITSHFAAGPQARWRGASDELYPGRYVRREQQSQRACGPQPEGARPGYCTANPKILCWQERIFLREIFALFAAPR